MKAVYRRLDNVKGQRQGGEKAVVNWQRLSSTTHVNDEEINQWTIRCLMGAKSTNANVADTVASSLKHTKQTGRKLN